MADTIKLAGKDKIVYLRNGKRVAFLKYCYPSDASKKRNIEIEWLFVKPEYRHQGIATKLLQFFLKKFKNHTWISFWTGKEMEVNNAWSLYAKLGFEQVYYQEDYYEDGVGTRLFVKRLHTKITPLI